MNNDTSTETLTKACMHPDRSDARYRSALDAPHAIRMTALYNNEEMTTMFYRSKNIYENANYQFFFLSFIIFFLFMKINNKFI